MKKTLLLLAFCGLTTLQAIAVPIEANQWNVLEFRAIGFDGKEEAVIYEFTLSADTIINNETYAKVMQRATLTSDAPKYAAAIRQEEDKVYVCHDNKEYLLYDFGAKAGDEIMVWGGLDHPTTLCKNRVKDVQTTDDGKRILTIGIADSDPDVSDEEQFRETAQWIEGIGSTNGLLHTGVTYPGGSSHYLQCAYYNGVQVYERKDDYYAQFGCEHNSNIGDNLESTRVTDSPIKYMKDGRLFLKVGDAVYDILGRTANESL